VLPRGGAERKLGFTTALGPGYGPQDHYIPFKAIITLEPKGEGTRYHVLARHKDEATAKAARGEFHEGWSKALDQLEVANTGLWARPREMSPRPVSRPSVRPRVQQGTFRLLVDTFCDTMNGKERHGEPHERAIWTARRTACDLT
jgi:hypothetical protein